MICEQMARHESIIFSTHMRVDKVSWSVHFKSNRHDVDLIFEGRGFDSRAFVKFMRGYRAKGDSNSIHYYYHQIGSRIY